MSIVPRLREISPGWLCIAALLTIHLLFGIDAACRHAVTHDEYWHLPAGLAASVSAYLMGARIFRTHDVKETVEALRVAERVGPSSRNVPA